MPWRPLLLCVLFAVFLVLQVHSTSDNRQAVPSTSNGEMDRDEFRVSEPPLPDGIDAYREIVERPLFAADRRPPEEAIEEDEPVGEEAQPVEEPSDPPDAILLAIITGGDRNRALVKVNDSQLLWMSVGDDIDGWTLASLTGTTAQFRRADQELDLPLRNY